MSSHPLQGFAGFLARFAKSCYISVNVIFRQQVFSPNIIV